MSRSGPTPGRFCCGRTPAQKNVPELAAIHEETINICWHALSFWWFNRLDGRGPNGLLENLRQHVQTTAYIARTGKPLEANVSHHFAFRGGDDVTYIVSAYLAAKLAKKNGGDPHFCAAKYAEYA